MKSIVLSIAFLALSLLSLSSCEKVVQLDLNDSDRVYVVDGMITNIGKHNYLKLSKSDNFYETNQFEKIEGAVVTITDDQGNTIVYTETDPGYYSNTTFTAQAYTNYHLKIEVDGDVIEADTYVPGVTPIDSIRVEPNQGGFFGDGYSIFPYWFDKGSETNFFRVRNFKKSPTESEFDYDESIQINEDRLSNGIPTGIPIFSRSFDLADTVIVELMEIDEHNYKYWVALSQVSSGQSAAPGNPESNLSGDALGYFGGYNIALDTVVIE